MQLNCHLFLLLLLPCIGASSSSESMNSEDGEDNSKKSNSSSPIVIRRKTPSRASSGGNRFSLMNSRFNRRPRKKNLDREHLLEILGDFYDPNWMSIEEPASLQHEDKGTTYVVRKDAWPYQELKKALEILDLSVDAGNKSTSAEKDRVSSKTFASIIEKWLLEKASCPVKYAWEDIGNMFWPRWIKRGECATVPGTCSWPPGMHCVESNRSNLHLLRWQCRAPKSKGIGGRRRQSKFVDKKDPWNRRFENEPVVLRCQWVRVPYPITSACHCTC